MKKGLVKLIILLVVVISAIKFVPFINSWAREVLPEQVLALIGEKPKGIFERGSDLVGDSIEKGSELVDDLVDKVKN